jgi:hypothetical protein
MACGLRPPSTPATLATETMLLARCGAMASDACFIPSAVPTGFVCGILKGTLASIR